MQVVFVVVSLAGAVWFLTARRRVDFFTVGYFSSAIYFTPGYVGYDLFLTPLDPRMYTVFTVVLLAVWGGGALNRRAALSPPPRSVTVDATVLTLVAAGIVAYVFLVYGWQILLVHKSLSPIAGGVAILWRVTASLGFIAACLSRRWLLAFLGGMLLLLMFVASDRTAIAMVMLALSVEGFRRYGAIRLGPRLRRAVVPGLAALVLLWGGKAIQLAIGMGFREKSVTAAVDVLRSPYAKTSLLTRSEPFNTQALLNGTLQHDLRISPEHLLNLPYMLWIAPSMFGESSAAFNDAAQDLFPSVRRRSMAYNFWAEGLASGGWLLFGVYVLIYVTGLWGFDRLSQTRHGGWRSIWLLMGAYWAFYIQRNSMASIITYEKQVLYVGGALLLAAMLLPRVQRSRAGSRFPAAAVPAPAN